MRTTDRKGKHPQCVAKNCRRRATRWDGGVCGYVVVNKVLQVSPPRWLCSQHDPNHKSFDLPTDLPGAIEDLVALRGVVQAMVEDAHSKYLESKKS